MTSFDLRRLKLRPGEQHREAIELELPAFEFGGQRYVPVPELVTAQLDVTRAVTGTALALALTVRLHGPCYRCLGDAVLEVPISVREYQASSPDDDRLDVSSWARDAVALALPDKILCRPGCAGLCPECGENLNDNPHTHEETTADPRWAALEALREQS